MTQSTQVTSAEETKRLIQEKRYSYYTLPELTVTVKYRNPDLLKLAFNGQLPTVLAEAVINAYKEGIGGADMEEYKRKVSEKKVEADDPLVKEIGDKGYNLLESLVVSHKILPNVQSDFETEIPIIAWSEIPQQDAIAFLMMLIERAQKAATKSGGEVSTTELTTFPDKGRRTKRNSVGKSS